MDAAWKQIVLPPDAPMRRAMEVLDRTAMQIVLVVEADGCHLLGTVTDGDIRRALLKDLDMATPAERFMNPNPYTGLIDEGPASWQRTMQRHGLRHLPILDARGCVRDLARFEPPSEPERPNPVVIMAGGLGLRLRPLTEQVPKPLLKVGERPVLETIVEAFVGQGFRHIFVCINYKGEMIREHFGDGSAWDAEIRYLEETKRLGTAGALSLLPESPSAPLLVMNGDLLTRVDFVRLLEFHRRQGFAATLAMREYRTQIPYGVLRLEEGYRVREFSEKPVQRYQVNAGIYVLDPEVIDTIPPDTYVDMPALLGELMAAGRPVGGFPLRDYWLDIGRLEDLERAHAEFAEVFS